MDLELLLGELTDPVDADRPTERGVLQGDVLAAERAQDLEELRLRDHVIAEAQEGVFEIRVVEVQEDVKPAVVLDLDDAVAAERRDPVPGLVLVSRSPARTRSDRTSGCAARS